MPLSVQRPGAAAYNHNGKQDQQRKGNHTLEDVAEEMLNGMFCHYEPPDPRRAKRNKRGAGILKAPRASRQFERPQEKRLRWSDGVEHTANNMRTQTDARCNIVSNCIDAGVEVGIVSPGSKNQAEKFWGQYDYDLQKQTETVAGIMKKRQEKALEKQKRRGKVVFDDDGNLTAGRQGMPMPPPPPPPPPPSRNERFIPELCGVGINCVDDDVHLQNLAKCYSGEYPPPKYYRRPSQPYDYDDETNSIVSEEESYEEQPSRSPKRKVERPSTPKAAPKVKVKTPSPEPEPEEPAPVPPLIHSRSPGRRFLGRTSTPKKDEDDWETNSNTSSLFFRRMWPSNRGGGSKLNMVDFPVEVDHEISSPREEKAVMEKAISAMDTVEMGRFGSNTVDPRKSSRSKSPLRFLRKSPRFNKNNDMGDWDESLPIVPAAESHPIVPVAQSAYSRNRGRSQSPSRGQPTSQAVQSFQAVQPVQSFQPAPPPPPTRGRSKSPSRRWTLGGRSKKKQARDPSPGPIRRSQSRDGDHRRTMEAANKIRGRQSLNPSAMSRARSKSPLKSAIKNNRGVDGSESFQSFATDPAQQDAMERQSFITDHRRGFESSAPPPPPQMLPYRSPVRQMGTQAQMQPQMQAQMLQAHMQAQGQVPMQMQPSYTQMPQGYPQMQPGHHQAGQPGHRQMRPGQPPMQPGHPLMHPAHPLNRPATRDDAMERESFITGHRAGFDGPRGIDDRMERQSLITAHRQVFDGPPPPPPAPAMRRPASSRISHDDRLERQSDITAHRESFENNGRSRSPYRRSHSFEQEFSNDPSQGPIRRGRSTERTNTTQLNESRGRSRSMERTNTTQLNASRGRSRSTERTNTTQLNASRGRSRERTNDALPVMRQDPRRMSDPLTYNQGMQQPPPPPIYNQVPIYSQVMQLSQLSQYPPVYNQAMQQPQPTPAYNQAMQQTQPSVMVQPVAQGAPLVEKQEVAPEQKPESEMSWEERTRLAWERIRGDLASSLTLETPTKEKQKLEEPPEVQEGNYSLPPVEGVLRRQNSSESGKKVTFGQDEIRLHPSREQLFQEEQHYEDEQDENQSFVESPRPETEIIKKKVFRGSRIIGRLFGKDKDSPGKIKLSNSRSLDLTATATMSQDLSENMNSRSMDSDYGMYNSQQPMQSANIGIYNGQMPMQTNYGMAPVANDQMAMQNGNGMRGGQVQMFNI